MAGTYTTNLNFYKPDYGDAGENWWHEINANFDIIDALAFFDVAAGYVSPPNNANLSFGDSDDLTQPTVFVELSTNDGGGIGAPSCGHIAVYSHVERLTGGTYTFNPNFFYYEPQELLNYQDVNTTFFTFVNAASGGGSGSTTFGTWTMCVGPTGGTGRVFGAEINVEERRGVQAHINTGTGFIPSNSSVGLVLVPEQGFSAGDTCAQGYDGTTVGYDATCALTIGRSAIASPNASSPRWLTGIAILQNAITPSLGSPYQNEAIYLGGGSNADNDYIGMFFNGYYTTPIYLYPATCRDNYAITMHKDQELLWIGGSPTVYTRLHRSGTDVYWWDGSTDWKLNSISASGAHDILSATHSDTVAGSPVAGDIIYANATPKWTKLAKGNNGQKLALSSGLPAWQDDEYFQFVGGGSPDGWEKVCDITLSDAGSYPTAPRTYIDIIGLNGDEDEVYMIDATFVLAATGRIYLRPNNDSGENYNNMRFTSDTIVFTDEGEKDVMTWLLAEDETGLDMINASSVTATVYHVHAILRAKKGKYRLYHANVNWEYFGIDFKVHNSEWHDLTNNITSLRITGSASNMLDSGTSIRVYRNSIHKKREQLDSADTTVICPHGSYRAQWGYEFYWVSGTRSLEYAPGLARPSSSRWRLDIYKSNEVTFCLDNWDSVYSYGTNTYTFKTTSKPTWSAKTDDSPILPGRVRGSWQARFTTDCSFASGTWGYWDLLVVGDSFVALYNNMTAASHEVGIISSLFFQWRHIKPPQGTYNMGGYYSSSMYNVTSTAIPSAVLADDDLGHWYLGPFGIFVYDNGTDVIQGIPTQAETLLVDL